MKNETTNPGCEDGICAVVRRRSSVVGCLENFGGAFFEDADAVADAFFFGDFAEPAGRFVHVFEGESEGAVVHGDEVLGFDVVEDFHGVVGAHVDVFKILGAISADGEQGDFGGEVLADVLEAFEVGAVAGVINFAALMFEHEAAVAAVVIAQRAGAPVFAGCEGDFPIAVGEAFPPIEFDDAFETEVAREVAHAPGHDADFWMREFAEAGFVKVVKVGVGEQDEIDGGQVFDLEAGAFDAFEEEKPVGEVGVDEDVEVGELDEERGVANPGERDLALFEPGKFGFFVRTVTGREEGFQDHLVEEGARIESVGWCEVFERLGQLAFLARWAMGSNRRFRHKFLLSGKICQV